MALNMHQCTKRTSMPKGNLPKMANQQLMHRLIIASLVHTYYCQFIITFSQTCATVFNSLARKFSSHTCKNLKGPKGLEKFARYPLVKVTPTNQNHANLI